MIIITHGIMSNLILIAWSILSLITMAVVIYGCLLSSAFRNYTGHVIMVISLILIIGVIIFSLPCTDYQLICIEPFCIPQDFCSSLGGNLI